MGCLQLQARVPMISSAREVSPAVCATQQDYFALWRANNLEQLAPTVLAEQGGRLADRAAWVFVGAYQGAMRQCFGQLRAYKGWASYLVSEARDESRQPTCTLERTATGLLLQGTKSWVAARSHLETVVVNATQDAGATANVLVPLATEGVALLEKPSGRFLPELAVGSAQFDAVRLPEDALLAEADTHAALFGMIEARCLLVALAGHFSAWAPGADAPREALMLASGLTTSELGQHGSIAILLEAMTLLVTWFEQWVAAGSSVAGAPAGVNPVRERWQRDGRLLQMHRPLLEKRLQAASNAP